MRKSRRYLIGLAIVFLMLGFWGCNSEPSNSNNEGNGEEQPPVTAADRRVVGYFENWAQYRDDGEATFHISNEPFFATDVDPSILTDLVIGFGMMGYKRNGIYDPYEQAYYDGGAALSGDFAIYPAEWNAIEFTDGGYSSTTGYWNDLVDLKQVNPDLNIFLAVGGWSFTHGEADGGSDYSAVTKTLFSEMVADAANRNDFITKAIWLSQTYGFDGIDIDWEYPGDLANGGTAADMANLLTFFKEAYPRFQAAGLKLTYASPAVAKGNGIYVDEAPYDPDFFEWLQEISEYVDWLNVMAYDMYGHWDGVMFHQAPLYASSADTDTNRRLSVDKTVTAMLDAGIEKKKIVLGMPTYSRLFGDPEDGTIGSSFSLPQGSSAYGYANGLLTYHQVEILRGGGGEFTVAWDDETKTPYMYGRFDDRYYFSAYSDEQSIGAKSDYIVDNGLGGGMIWALGLDDFHDKSYPLLNVIYDTLKGDD